MSFGSVCILWHGTQLDVLSTVAQGSWTGSTYYVVANSDETTPSFVGLTGGNAGALLDEVRVDAGVPEPAGVALTGGALILLHRTEAVAPME